MHHFQEFLDPNIFCGRTSQNWHQVSAADGGTHAGNYLRVGQLLALQVAVGQFIVRFSDRFNQTVARRFELVGNFGWDIPGRVHQIDHAFEVLGIADG